MHFGRFLFYASHVDKNKGTYSVVQNSDTTAEETSVFNLTNVTLLHFSDIT